MKTPLPAIFFFIIALFLFSCKEEKKHSVIKNPDSTIDFESFKLENGFDSSVSYSYYKNKAKASVSIGISPGPGRMLYNDICFYDSITGKRYQEAYIDSAGHTLREWSLRFDPGVKKMVEQERFGYSPDGKICMLRWSHVNEIPLEASYSPNEGNVSKFQVYDSAGRIDWAHNYDLTTKKDTTLRFETPEAKAAFHDSILEMVQQMRKKINFPTGNK